MFCEEGNIVIRPLLVLAAFTVLYGCGQASSSVEKQERDVGAEESQPSSQPAPELTTPPTDPSGGTAVGEVFAEAELRPVGDSALSGTVVFREVGSLGVQVALEVFGLPAAGNSKEPMPYFAQIHEGSCSLAPKGVVQEHGDDHHGHAHEQGGVGLSLALVRLDRFLGATPEYAHHPEYEEPPANKMPGNIDTPVLLGASADGTAMVTSLLEGVDPEQLTSGSAKYVDVRAPSHDAPAENWTALACADLN